LPFSNQLATPLITYNAEDHKTAICNYAKKKSLDGARRKKA